MLPTPHYPSFVLSRATDGSGYITTDSRPLQANGSNGIPTILESDTPFVTPTIGFILDF